MLRKANPITVDIGFLIAVILTMIVFSIADLPTKLPEYIPQAITGLTTATSIMAGVAGLLITRYLSNGATIIQKFRGIFYILVLVGVLMFVAGAYIALIAGEPAFAFKLMIAVFNICYMISIALVFHILYFTR